MDVIFDSRLIAVTKVETFASGCQFDPQNMLINAKAAAGGPTSESIASGWHATVLMLQLYADHRTPENGLPAPSVDEGRWVWPVRSIDTLRIHVTIEGARYSPDRGVAGPFSKLPSQHDEVVLTARSASLTRRRH